MTHEPKTYDLPHHLAKILSSKEFAEAAKEVGRTTAQFAEDVAQTLKEATEERRREELAHYEDLLAAGALYRAQERYRDFVAEALKELRAKYQAEEVAAHEAALSKQAISAAKTKKRSAA